MEIRKSISPDYEGERVYQLVNDNESSVWFTGVDFSHVGAYLRYGDITIASIAWDSVDEFKKLWEAVQ